MPGAVDHLRGPPRSMPNKGPDNPSTVRRPSETLMAHVINSVVGPFQPSEDLVSWPFGPLIFISLESPPWTSRSLTSWIRRDAAASSSTSSTPTGLPAHAVAPTDGLNIHRHRPDTPVADYRCKGCRRVFNMDTDTPWQGTHLSPAQIVMILRGIAKGGTHRQARPRGRHQPSAPAPLAARDPRPAR